jgi:hypothetical protein
MSKVGLRESRVVNLSKIGRRSRGMIAVVGTSLAMIAAGCADQKVVAGAQEQVSALLKDPASAQFRAVAATQSNDKEGWRVCGEVNARNSYGGYTGFRKFAWLSTGEVYIKSGDQSEDQARACRTGATLYSQPEDCTPAFSLDELKFWASYLQICSDTGLDNQPSAWASIPVAGG